MITILYATQTGNAEICAGELAKSLKAQDLNCRWANLARYKAGMLSDETTALFVVSTYGNGEPPDDATPFLEDLKKLEAGSLAKLRYAVFALGDKDHTVFCGFGHECDHLLEAAGATRLLACEECDLDHEERLPRWTARITEILQKGADESSGA